MNQTNLREKLLRGGLASIAIKVINTGLAFAISIILARVLGPEGYGSYTFVLAVVTILTLPAQAGLPQLVVRETAKFHQVQDWQSMCGTWRWSTRFIAFSSSIMMIIGAMIIVLKPGFMNADRLEVLLPGMFLIPLIALANIRGASLRGLKKVVVGQLPEFVVRPCLFLLIILFSLHLYESSVLTPQRTMFAFVFAAGLAFFFGVFLLQINKPKALVSVVNPKYNTEAWLKSLSILSIVAGMQLVMNYIDIVMIGVIRDDYEVGIYRVVLQLSSLVIFGLAAINQLLQPYFASMYQDGDMVKLQRLVLKSTKITTLCAIPPVIMYVCTGQWLLETIYGVEYAVGYWALIYLSLGQLINAGMGSVKNLLNMTGNEKVIMKGIFIAMLINIFLNLLLIPSFGFEGAAIASAFTLATWNFILSRAVKKKLNIRTSVFHG